MKLMHRMHRIILISHCILNQNSVVEPLARAKGAYNAIISEILKENIGIHQLPCPEFRHLGSKRPQMSKSDYDTLTYRRLCSEIAKDQLRIIQEYKSTGYEILGIIGINHSPTCSVKGNLGILIEEIQKEMKSENITIPMIDVPTDYLEEEKTEEFLEELRTILKK